LPSPSKRIILPAVETDPNDGEEVMKTLALAAALLTLSLAGSHAGPNEGGLLAIHGNITGITPPSGPCTDIPIPDTCGELVPTAEPDFYGIEWFLVIAAREPEPLSFNTIIFGIGAYDPEACYIVAYGPCHQELFPLEIPSAGWPWPLEGTAVSWAPECLEGNLVPVYFFGVYVYAPGQIPFGEFYPGHTSVFVSCTEPPEEDSIAAYGTMGCGGAEGENPCLPLPTSTRPTTWGQIKAVYR
jgi:hypothetical protein